MRLGIFAFLFAMACAVPAAAQTSITLNADPVPIIEAEINGRPVRLEVDPRFPRGLAMSRAAAERLRVTRVPFLGIGIGLEGSDATLSGRLARPRIIFPGGAEMDTESRRAFAGIFPAPVTTRADGVIGPGVLPYDIVTIVLGPEPVNARDIVFTLEDADEWTPQADVGGERVRLMFGLADRASIFNRTASRRFDDTGAITSRGELAETPTILGLRTLMQPVETALAVEGLPLAPAYARTNSPLLGATEEDAIVVRAEVEETPPAIMLGRAALERCSSIRVERRTRRMTLRCAA
jgi:hypothetical protein